MKTFAFGRFAVVFFFFLILFFVVGDSIRTRPHDADLGEDVKPGTRVRKGLGEKQGVEMEMYPMGSSVPDCTHACGPCSPCKRVTVSFKCSVAESCSVIYRCTCQGRSYHVPSRV